MLPLPTTDHPEVCRACGGNVEMEPSPLPVDRYPRRYVCLSCENEYGTTRPAVRNY